MSESTLGATHRRGRAHHDVGRALADRDVSLAERFDAVERSGHDDLPVEQDDDAAEGGDCVVATDGPALRGSRAAASLRLGVGKPLEGD